MVKYYCDRCGKEVTNEQWKKTRSELNIMVPQWRFEVEVKPRKLPNGEMTKPRKTMRTRNPELCFDCAKEINDRLEGFEPFKYAIEQGDFDPKSDFYTAEYDPYYEEEE